MRASHLTQTNSPISFSCLWLRPDPRTPAPARGNRRWTGALPLIAARIGRGGGAPVSMIPAVRPEMTPVMGEMGRINTPDIHEQRLETLRKQAVERLRSRRAGTNGRGHHAGALLLGGFPLMVVKKDGRQRFAHVPLHVLGQQAQEHIGAHPVRTTVVEGANLPIHRLHVAEDPLDLMDGPMEELARRVLCPIKPRWIKKHGTDANVLRFALFP